MWWQKHIWWERQQKGRHDCVKLGDARKESDQQTKDSSPLEERAEIGVLHPSS